VQGCDGIAADDDLAVLVGRENSQSMSPSPASSRLAVTVALQVSTSSGQNRDAKRIAQPS